MILSKTIIYKYKYQMIEMLSMHEYYFRKIGYELRGDGRKGQERQEGEGKIMYIFHNVCQYTAH